MLLRGIGQALLARGLISHASSALNRKGWRMRSSQVCDWDLAKSWMISTRVFGCQCQCRNSHRFYPSILRHSWIWGAADEAVSNNIHKKGKNQKNSSLKDKDGYMLLRGIGQALLAGSNSHAAANWTVGESYVLLSGVGQTLLARGLISHTSSALNRKGRWMRSSEICGWNLIELWMRSSQVMDEI
jgi:hypothetical protein